MAAQTLTNVGIWIAGIDYSGVSNTISGEFAADAPEATHFRPPGGYRVRVAGGLKTSSFSFDGYVDDASPAVELWEDLAGEESVMVVPAGFNAGDLAYVIPVTVSAHMPIGASIGDLAALSYASEGNGQPDRARVFDVREGVTADVTASRVQLGEVAAGRDLPHMGPHSAERGHG